MADKIKFRDLNAWLKTAIIFLYIQILIYIAYFIVGFIEGVRIATGG